jgi:hypothetical protein
MKIALWTTTVAAGLALLAACGHDDNNTTTSMGSGSTGTGSSAPSSAPSSTAPSDFAQFVNQQIGMDPAFGSAPEATSSLNTDLELGTANAFAATNFGAGDTLTTGTYSAAAACTAAGKSACNPAVSADLNSTLN